VWATTTHGHNCPAAVFEEAGLVGWHGTMIQADRQLSVTYLSAVRNRVDFHLGA